VDTIQMLDTLVQQATVSISSPNHEEMHASAGIVATVPHGPWRIDVHAYVKRSNVIAALEFSVSARTFDAVVRAAYEMYEKLK
jgi:hypothetical protein